MKKKHLRVAGLVCLAVLAVAITIGYRVYNKPHPSAATADAVEMTAMGLASEFEKDEPNANKKYLGNAVQVSGTVSDVSVNQQNKPVIVLLGSDMSGVQCTLERAVSGIKKGDSITVKGFCAGYLSDVIMDRCIVSH